MEIERKYLIPHLPDHLEQYPYYKIEQGYLCISPVVRIRRQNSDYYLTYKSDGMMVREEYNLALSQEAYEHLRPKTDGILISKTRYILPLKGGLKIELDLFDPPYGSLHIAEVEFPNEKAANAFVPPPWFGEDVTFSRKYHNSTLSRRDA